MDNEVETAGKKLTIHASHVTQVKDNAEGGTATRGELSLRLDGLSSSR
jgi:hypothetical protein